MQQFGRCPPLFPSGNCLGPGTSDQGPVWRKKQRWAGCHQPPGQREEVMGRTARARRRQSSRVWSPGQSTLGFLEGPADAPNTRRSRPG